MITALDTNILLDILISGAPHLQDSRVALENATRAGNVVISEPVYCEVAGRFENVDDLDRFLSRTGLSLHASSETTLYQAGRTWATYVCRRPRRLVCPECGHSQDVRCQRCQVAVRSRQHIIADFIIGAHASLQADRLLTRDRGFYAMYFPQLMLG